MAVPILALVIDGDFVNGAKEKLNDAIKAIPVLYTLDNEGNLTITRFDGSTDVVQFQQVFAKLGLIFDDLLPKAATYDEPGIVPLADDDLPSDLDSETKVLSAAAVIRQIIKYASTSGNGLDGVMHINPHGNGQLFLDEGIVDTLTGETKLPELILSTNKGGVKVPKAGMKAYGTGDADGAVTNGTSNVMSWTANTVRFWLDYTFFSGFVTFTQLGIKDTQIQDNPDYIAGFSFDSVSKTWVPNRVTKAQLKIWLNQQTIDYNTDAQAKSYYLAQLEALPLGSVVEGIAVFKTIADGKKKIVTSTFADVALALAPFLKDLLGTGTGGGTTSKGEFRFMGCLPEAKAPSPSTVQYQINEGFDTPKTHNCQTNELAIRAYVYSATDADNKWIPDYTLPNWVKVLDSDRICMKADTPPEYLTLRYALKLEPMFPTN